MSRVYFVRNGEAVKIGRASSLTSRVRSLECANSGPLEVLAAVPGGERLEAEMHGRFARLRIRGEWFRYEGELREHVAGLQRSGGAVTMAKKRGYSRDFTPRTDRRIKREIDRVPPMLDEKVQAKCRREGISLRALTLTLWRRWADGDIAIAVSLESEGKAK